MHNNRKTEYIRVNERQDNGTVRMQGEEVAKVDHFKYLGSTVQCNGECGMVEECGMVGVICDSREPARVYLYFDPMISYQYIYTYLITIIYINYYYNYAH